MRHGSRDVKVDRWNVGVWGLTEEVWIEWKFGRCLHIDCISSQGTDEITWEREPREKRRSGKLARRSELERIVVSSDLVQEKPTKETKKYWAER